MSRSDEINQKGLVRTNQEKEEHNKTLKRQKYQVITMGLLLLIAILIFIPWKTLAISVIFISTALVTIFFNIISSIVFWLFLIFCSLIDIAYSINRSK